MRKSATTKASGGTQGSITTKTEQRKKVTVASTATTRKSTTAIARTKATVTRTANLTTSNNNSGKNTKLKGSSRMSMIEERRSET